jgi:hypothetical protein
MNRYDVRIEPMPDNPVREERRLGQQSGLYRLELWERIITSPNSFEFVRFLEEDLLFPEAQKKQVELVNRLNGSEPPPMA